MRTKNLIRICLSTLLATTALEGVAQSEKVSLRAGDPAPALKIKKWMQGNPVTKIERGKVYVFEFWATWCGPCIANMPHLSEMAKKYEGRVTITGVDVWETGHDKNSDPVALVAAFMKKNPGRMSYNVAVDDGEFMGDNWLKAAGQNGIPSSFIIGRDGKIAWIGHPYYMEPVLEKVVAGKFDRVAYEAEEKAKRDAEAAKDAPNRALIQPVDDALKAKQYEKVLEMVASLEKEHPDLAMRVVVQKFKAMTLGKNDKALQTAFQNSLDAPKPDPMAVLAVLDMVEAGGFQKHTYVLAGKYLQDYGGRNEAVKNLNVLNLLAKVYLKAEDYDMAIAFAQQAVDAGKEQKILDSQMKTHIDMLRTCKAAKAARKGGTSD